MLGGAIMSQVTHGTTIDECAGSWYGLTDFINEGDCFDFTDGIQPDPWAPDGAEIKDKCAYADG